MNMRPLIALGAGLAGVLLFLVSAKGSPAAVLIAYFTPLPIMIAAMGWGQSLGLAAAVAGGVFLAIVVDPFLSLRYAIGFGLPAWYLAYLALLAHTDVADPAGQQVPGGVVTRWYPVGNIVLWAIGAAVLASLIAAFALGAGSAAVEQQMRAAAERFATVAHSAIGSNKVPSEKEIVALAGAMVRVLPIAGAVSLTLLYLANLWTAGRVVQLSHRLVRPWPNIPDNLRLPRIAAPIFAVALAFAIVAPGLVGLCGRMVAASLGCILALQALAVAHVLTRPVRGRGAILAALYVGIFMLIPFSLVALVAMGLTDLFIPLRNRRFRPPGGGRST